MEADKLFRRTIFVSAWCPSMEESNGDGILDAKKRPSLDFEHDIVKLANDKFGFFDGLQSSTLIASRMTGTGARPKGAVRPPHRLTSVWGEEELEQ